MVRRDEAELPVPRLVSGSVGDRPLSRVFVSPKMAEAKQAEALLTEQGIDYVVHPEPLSRTLLGSPRYWAAFYVDPEHVRISASVLAEGGLAAGVVFEGSDPEG
jgi:hypothetical protein